MTTAAAVHEWRSGTGRSTSGAPSEDLAPGSDPWIDVCPLEVIVPDSGVCALVNGEQVAIFRLHGEEIFAVENIDPFSHCSVLSRGIVGDREGIPTVASPVYKQTFDLRTGICLDDTDVRLPVFTCRVVDGLVQVRT